MFLSKPRRNFTEIGFLVAFTQAVIIWRASSGFFINAQPSPLEVIFRAGQPIFMFISVNLFNIPDLITAEKCSGVLPNNCTIVFPLEFSMAFVLSLL